MKLSDVFALLAFLLFNLLLVILVVCCFGVSTLFGAVAAIALLALWCAFLSDALS